MKGWKSHNSKKRNSKSSNFLDQRMETVILRFPHISQHIFKRLDIKSLTKCRIIARIWNEFICSEKNFWIEIILHLTYAKEVWRKVLKKSDLDNLSKFAKAICKHYKYSPKAIRKRMTPLHFAAQIGEIQIVKNSYIEKEIEKNPKDLEDWTPLHLAAQNGHLGTVHILRKRFLGLFWTHPPTI